jgi:hypothetical protein
MIVNLVGTHRQIPRKVERFNSVVESLYYLALSAIGDNLHRKRIACNFFRDFTNATNLNLLADTCDYSHASLEFGGSLSLCKKPALPLVRLFGEERPEVWL